MILAASYLRNPHPFILKVLKQTRFVLLSLPSDSLALAALSANSASPRVNLSLVSQSHRVEEAAANLDHLNVRHQLDNRKLDLSVENGFLFKPQFLMLIVAADKHEARICDGRGVLLAGRHLDDCGVRDGRASCEVRHLDDRQLVLDTERSLLVLAERPEVRSVGYDDFWLQTVEAAAQPL
jgi:hypothetical protein